MPIYERYINPFTDYGFKKIFGKAEFIKLPKVEQDKYHKNLKVYRDLINSIDTAHEEGRVEGRIAGKIEGKIEGKLEEKIEIALTSLNQGLEIEIISKITGLSVEEIEVLRDE